MESSAHTCLSPAPLPLSSPSPSPSPSSSPSPSFSSTNIRLWRPAAQRNLRNQWSKLAALYKQWSSAASSARSHATAIVNSFLSQRYMDAMELGVLSDMPNIKRKACFKFSKQQELHQGKLLSSYKDMVAIVVQMMNTSRSMRCYGKGSTSSSLAQFSSSADNQNDGGDGGGISVFTFLSISSFEELAEEFVQMFTLELGLKRLLVMALISIGDKKVSRINKLDWSNEFYSGEFDDLGACNLLADGACEPVSPSLKSCKPNTPIMQCPQQLSSDVLQVYLTTFLAEVNIDRRRVDEIFAVVGEEMHVTLC